MRMAPLKCSLRSCKLGADPALYKGEAAIVMQMCSEVRRWDGCFEMLSFQRVSVEKSCQLMNPLWILPPCNSVESICRAPDAPGQRLLHDHGWLGAVTRCFCPASQERSTAHVDNFFGMARGPGIPAAARAWGAPSIPSLWPKGLGRKFFLFQLLSNSRVPDNLTSLQEKRACPHLVAVALGHVNCRRHWDNRGLDSG